MRARPLPWLVAVALVVTVPGAAVAQPGSPPVHVPVTSPAASPPAAANGGSPLVPALGESLTGAPKDAYESAKQLFAASDFAGALIKFSAAYDGARDPRLLFNMATCETKLHHYAKSLGLMRRYVKDGGGLLTDQDRAESEAAIKAFEPLTSVLTLTDAEAGATVTLDEQPLGTTPLESLTIDIGLHRLKVTKEGFHDLATDVAVSGAAPLSISARQSPIVHEGKLVVRAGDKNAIFVDGRAVGAATWTGALQSGGHALRVTGEGMIAFESEIVVEDGQTRDMVVTLQPQPSKIPLWAWVAGSVVVAGGLGVGAYFIFKPGPAQYNGPTGTLTPGVAQASYPLHLLRF